MKTATSPKMGNKRTIKNGITVGNKDSLTRFVKLRDELVAERDFYNERLSEINKALGADIFRNGHSNGLTPTGRPKNEKSLKEVTLEILKEKGAMNKHQLLDEVLKRNYQFASNDPLNSLGVIIYSKKNKIKNKGGIFSLV